MKSIGKLIRRALALFAALALLGTVAIVGAYYYLAPELPSVEVLRDVRFQVPLQVYSRDGRLIAEYGDKKRYPIRYQDLPPRLVQAIISAEDDRFFEHPGVDYQGLLRAAYYLITTGEKSQGGSTITMQVTRNFFLSREKTYLRKLKEIFLSLKIEQALTKEQILELYFNKIYFGNRAYGVASAAQVYYGRPLDQLTLAELAMIAGLPKAPSRYNPIANTNRALIRRNYVLSRMHELGYITTQEYEEARAQPATARLYRARIDLEAPYIGEMVRAQMFERYGEEAYTRGFKVYTTIDGEMQAAANRALRKALLAYDERHGFRGPLGHVEGIEPELLPGEPEGEAQETADSGTGNETSEETQATTTDFGELLADYPRVAYLQPAVVVGLAERRALVALKNGERVELAWEGLAWARPFVTVNRRGPAPQRADEILTVGDIVYVTRSGEEGDGPWRLSQIPTVSGAIVALDPHDGAIQALTGGFDFFYSKFNRATQAKRQPGSSFKPFVYSAALEKGFTPASIINDAPVVFDDPGLETSWRPENYSGRIYGPTRLRQALIKSRNLVSIRLLQAIGIDYCIDYLTRFGFDPATLPKDLSLSLGSAAITPLELASAYTVFANGGYRVEPYFIDRIEDMEGNVIERTTPLRVCPECEEEEKSGNDPLVATPEAVEEEGEPAEPPAFLPAERVVPERNVYQITSMMRDVIRYGTGRRARSLGRNDLAGKTGTTNDQRDAWFAGFNGDLVAISWTGFDDARPLGDKETGSRAALPMWIDFMKVALAGRPETPLIQPEGMITVRIDPETGLLAAANQRDAIFETFRIEYAPKERAIDVDASSLGSPAQGEGGDAPDEGTPPPQQLLF